MLDDLSRGGPDERFSEGVGRKGSRMNPAPALETLISVYGHLGGSQAVSGSSSSGAPPPPISSANSASGSSGDDNASSDRPASSVKGSSKSSSKKKQPPAKKRNGVVAAKDNKRSKRKKSSQHDDDESGSDSEEESGEEKSRFRWTDELHQYFLACVFELGLEIASPKKVYLKMMADPNFAKSILDDEMFNQMTNPEVQKKFGAHHVKSHLQRFRSNIVHPREAFIKQLVDLMQEAKRRKKEDSKNKVLNPEYHAYPFAADRIYPDNMTSSELASMFNNATALLKPTMSSSGSAVNMMQTLAPPPPPLFGIPVPPPQSTYANSAAAAAMILTRPRTLSSYEAGEQMRVQVEMRERIESQGHRQVVQAPAMDEFDALPNVLGQEDDNLFDWLLPDYFPKDEGGTAGASSSSNGKQ